jgi:glutamine synthetase
MTQLSGGAVHNRIAERDEPALDLERRLADLRARGVENVRITYSDIHGIARGKDVPLERFGHASADGLAFCCANLADGLAFSLAQLSDRIAGGPVDPRFPDMRVRPVLSTLTVLPWDPATAWCLGRVDADDPRGAAAPRSALERAAAAFRDAGLTAVCAAELEFYLLTRGVQGGFGRYTDQMSMIYTVGDRSDPQGVVRDMVRCGRELGLDVVAVHHECGRGQFEINLNHGEALDAGDRAFRFKYMVKEMAARRNLLATFMGKPFADDASSGLHLHVSVSRDGGNAFFDPDSSDQLSLLARRFLAGVLTHAPALSAFGSPTINSYKRIVPGSLVPTAVNWSYDDRTTYVRVPPERGPATRLELRAADAAANPYLVFAANLFAGLDGIERELEPPAADSSPTAASGRLPASLDESLEALAADQALVEAIGRPIVSAFCALKAAEADRFRRVVTDWELSEYVWHL